MGNFNILLNCIAGAPQSWTPVLNFNNTPLASGQYSASGTYVQIGKAVLVEAFITVTSTSGASSGETTITGLPVMPNSYVGVVSVPYYGRFTLLSCGGLTGYIKTDQQVIVLTTPGTTGHQGVQFSNFAPIAGQPTNFYFAAFYMAQ
jgi:hypothetical protein